MNQEILPVFSEKAQSIKAGSIYEHYKGFAYKIVGVARDSQTLEELVVYQALYGQCDIWVRPLEEFLEDVFIDKQQKARFKLLEQLG